MKIWASGINIQCIQGTFDRYVFKVILGSFSAFPILCNLVHVCSSKMAGRTAKWMKLWVSSVCTQSVRGTFDRLVFKISLRSF